VVSKSLANATCVNAAVNVVVDRAGAAACRSERKCPGTGSYPIDSASIEERNCWVECYIAALLGRSVYASSVVWAGATAAGVSRNALVGEGRRGVRYCTYGLWTFQT
jgi:hypothetical protein